MSKSRARLLAELLNSAGRVKKDKSDLAGADSIIDLDTLPTITNAKLENSSISVAGHSVSLGGSVSLDTEDITEHENYPYFTNARARSAISVSGSTISYNSTTGVITSTANNYVLPTATSSTLGGVKIGYTENGKNYPVELSSGQMYVNVPWVDTNTTYSVGDGGLTQNNFTTTLKNKLDGIESGATADQTQAEINALGITATGLSGSPNITVGSITANDLVTESNTTKDSQGPYDWVTIGSGSRAAALRINDIAGANYLIRAGSYGLRFMKHVDAATDSFRDIMRFTATGVGDTTPHVVISNNLTVGGTVTWSGGSSTNANTAYGWGDHSAAGYLTSHQSLAAYATLASPALTGTPTAPTASAGTNTTQIATTAFVTTAVDNIVDAAPGTLNTLNELAAALGDDANFSTTVTNSIATKLPLAGGTMTGRINFFTTNVNPPTSSDATTGARINLYPQGSGRDYTIGIESSNMWFNTDGGFKWYEDGAARMQMETGGHFNLSTGSLKTNGVTRIANNGNATLGTISSGAITSSGTLQSDDITIKGGTSTTTASVLTFENYADTAHLKSKYTDPNSTTETYLAFHTNKAGEENGTVSESMRLSGNNLSVNGTISSGAITSGAITSNGNLTIKGTQGFNATGETASIYLGDTASEIRATYNGGTRFFLNGTDRMEIEGSTGNLNLKTGNFEINGTTVIDSSRNLTNIGSVTATGLGINESSRLSPVHITVTSSQTALTLQNTAGGSGSNVGLDFITYNDTSGYANPGARISAVDDGSHGGDLTFYGKASGIAGALSTIMTVKAKGDVEVNSGDLDIKSGDLELNGTARITNAGNATLGTISANSGSTLTLSGSFGYGVTLNHGDTGTSVNADALSIRRTSTTGTKRAQIGLITNDTDGLHHRGHIYANRDTVDYGGKIVIRVRSSASGYDDAIIARYNGDVEFPNGDLKMGSTTFIDSSRNLTNIGTISSGAITSSGLIKGTRSATSAHVDYLQFHMPSWSGHAGYLKNLVWHDGTGNIAAIGAEYDGAKTNIHFHSQYNSGYESPADKTFTVYGNGNVNVLNNFLINGTTRIAQNGNATLGTISSGAITSSGNLNITGAGNGILIDNSSGGANIGIGEGVRPANSVGHTASDDEGIFWHSDSSNDYGIYRTAGSWSSPSYQKLRIRWPVGIELDGGNSTYTNYGVNLVSSSPLRMNGNIVIDSSRNITAGTISSGAITSSSTVQGTAYLVGSTVIVNTNRDLTNIGTISSGAISAAGSVNLGSTTDGSRRFKWYNDNYHSLYYDNDHYGSQSAEVFTYYQNIAFRHQDSTSAVRISGSSGDLSTTGTISSGAITSSGTLVSTINGNNTTGGNLLLGATGNNAAKWGAVVMRQYNSDTETEGYSLITGSVGNGVNNVVVGGGLDEQNAASVIYFKAASNTSTRNGTEIARINTDGLDIRNNVLRITGTTVIDGSRNLSNVTANASIINAGTFPLARMPANLASTASTSTDSGLYFRSSNEKISGEVYALAFYAYNANDGFLFLNRDGSSNAKAVFHIGGYNNATSAGYSSEDTVITISRNDGAKAENLATGLSASSYRSRIVKTTTETIFADTQGKHRFDGYISIRRNSDNLRLETVSNPTNYYAIIETPYNYGKAFTIRARGAGNEYEIMKWADAAGLEFNGGANSIIKFSGDNLSNIGTISSGAITTSANFLMTGGYSMYIGSTSRFSSDNNGGFGINYGTTGGTTAASLSIYNNTTPTIELNRDGSISSGNITCGAISSGFIASSGYRIGDDYAIMKFQTPYFTHNTSNLACDLILGNDFINTVLEVELTGGYSNQNATGLIRRRWYVGFNSNGSIWQTPILIDETMEGPIVSQLFVSDPFWDSSASTYKIRIYKKNNTGNAFRVLLKNLSNDSADALATNAGMSGLLTNTSTTSSHSVGTNAYSGYRVNGTLVIDSNKRLLVSDGSASAPYMTFAADTNTGFYRPAADNIGFAVGGAARAFMSGTQFNMTGNGVFSGYVSSGSHVVSTTDLISNQDIQLNRSGTSPAITVYNHQGFRLVTDIGTGTSRTSTVGVNDSGVFYTNTGFAVNGTTVIDSSRNLTNVASLSINHASNVVSSITNADAGGSAYTHRANRLLTSNGSNWATDGRDPMMAFSSGNSATTIGNSIGITMHNESPNDNTFSPMIAFSNKSNSGSYNTTYASIVGRKTGQGADANWSAGELWFYAMPEATYASNYPTMYLDQDGLSINGSSSRNADTRLFIHGHGAYDPCIFLFNHLQSPSEGLEIWYDNDNGSSYITNKFSTGSLKLGTGTGSALKSVSNTRFEITGVGHVVLGGDNFSPYISRTETNTLNAGWGNASDSADMWINYRGYQNGTSYFRDFRIGNGKNVALVFVDGSARTVDFQNNTVIQVGGTTVIDASRSLNNIPNIAFSSANGTNAISLNDGSINFRTASDHYHKMWYFDGLCFATNYSHGHFRFYAETNTQRSNSAGGHTLVFDIDAQNQTVTASGNITAYSDIKLKDDIQPIENALEKVCAIRGVTFTRKDHQDKTKRHMGVIAQEVEAAGLNEVVEYNEEKDVKTVSYGNMVGALIEAIKEQSAQINAQQEQINQLTNMVNALKEKS